MKTFIILMVANQIAGVGGPVTPEYCDQYVKVSNAQIEHLDLDAREYFEVKNKSMKFECRNYYEKPEVELKGSARSL